MARQRRMLGPKPGKDKLLIKRGSQNVSEALAGMKGGETRAGFLGEGNIIRKPDYMPQESLDADAVARKRVIQSLLIKVITPNMLSNKSSPEQDRRSLVNKLNKSKLDELKRLLPSHLNRQTTDHLQAMIDGTREISEEDKVEIQNLYMEISP